MYRYREIYMTNRTVKQHAEKINELSKGERIEATICDHDAEDRATLHENGIITIAAKKDVSLGIDRTSERIGMRPGVENDEPRIFFLRDSLVETDAQLAEAKRPTCTEQEFDGYVWANHKTKEVPVKKDDHGMDTTRYGVMYVDGGPGVVVSQELYEFFHD
jgi:phage terminase large subunit